LFEHDGSPAMWNSWFLEKGQHNWLDYGWSSKLDFAQKQGYLNTYRTPEVERWLESKEFGVFAVNVNALNNKTLHEMCIIFPRAWLICISEDRKLKTPFMLNQLVTIVPDQVSPYDVQWVHGIDQWISNRYRVMRQLNSHLHLSIDQGEAQAYFNKTREHLPDYQSSGHWGRKHIIRCILEPESEAMIRFEHDGMLMDKTKLKREEEFYFAIVEKQPIVTLQIWQENQSHAVDYNLIKVKKLEINDQSVLGKGFFYPKPSRMVVKKYNPKELKPRFGWKTIDMDGYLEIKTDGVNIL
jgi:hypothetical protein